MVAFFGESIASRADIAGCADTSPSGFHAPVHRGDQGSRRGGHDAVFQALPGDWLGNRRIRGVCILHRGLGESATPRVCAKYVLPKILLSVGSRLNDYHYSLFPIVLHYRFDGAL
jgi:hypothetical protein